LFALFVVFRKLRENDVSYITLSGCLYIMQTCKRGPFKIGQFDPPLFAVQRSPSGRWLVRAPDADPCGPAVRVVAAIDEVFEEKVSTRSWLLPRASCRPEISAVDHRSTRHTCDMLV
jgi:hypothetical protein